MGIFKTTREISAETVLQRKGDLLFNQIDGEVVMLSVENSEYYGIDKVGSRIWELLEKPISLKDLVKCLGEEYNVPEEQCTSETLSFLYKLYDKNLIHIG